MEELLKSLYPDAWASTLRKLQGLIHTYRDPQRIGKPLGANDAILITYGDGLRDGDRMPLQVLGEFSQDWLQECISAIHLLPCFPFSSDDGFSVIDYYAINPDLGDWADIESLSQRYELMFDAVVNHMSQESEWFQKFLKGEDPYNGYFIVADPQEDLSAVVRPRALPLLHRFDGKEGPVHVWTTFSRDQVDLNYRNPAVLLQVLDVLLFYASKGARFIRLDAIAFLWKESGTACIHLEETHQLIRLFRKVLDEALPGTYLISETNVPHAENISYFGNGRNEAHMVYNFSLPPLLAFSLMKEEVSVLTSWAQSLELKEGCHFFNFTASHDGIGVRPLQGIVPVLEVEALAQRSIDHGGFVSYKDNGDGTRSPYELNCNYMDLLTDPAATDDLRIGRFLLTQSVMLCMPGVPGIYIHSLLGSRNDRGGALASGIHRRINREKLELEELVGELRTPGSFRSRVFNAYRKLLAVRRSQPGFDPSTPATFDKQGPVFIVIREGKASLLIALHNFSSQAVNCSLPSGQFSDLLDSSEFSDTVALLPFEFRWLTLVSA